MKKIFTNYLKHFLFLAFITVINISNVFSQNNLWSEINMVQDGSKTLHYRAKNGIVRYVQLNKSVLSETSFIINLSSFTKSQTFESDKIENLKKDGFIWYGRTADKKNNATFVVTNNIITGNLQVDYKTYRIVPVDNTGVYAVYEFDTQGLPENECGNSENTRTYPMLSNLMTDMDSNPVIRLLVSYTAAARTRVINMGYGSMYQFTLQAIAETNQSFINSNVSHWVELSSLHQVSYSESGNFSTDLSRYMSTSDGYMNEVHNLRTKYSADVAVILIDNSQYCGLAAGIGSNYSTAFCAVNYDCAVGYYSFAHEIAHLHGCRHNPEADNTNTPFPYGHGYVNFTDGWRTIMAYNNSSCPGGNCERIQYWSNPDLYYGGGPMGTTTRHDNARVLDETSLTLSEYSSIPLNIVLSTAESINNDEAGFPVASNSIKLTTGFSVINGSTMKTGVSLTLKGTKDLDNEITDEVIKVDDDVLLYPNPISDNLFFKGLENFDVSIFDLTGRKLIDLSSVSGSINLSNLNQGIYAIHVKFEGRTYIQKIIKK